MSRDRRQFRSRRSRRRSGVRTGATAKTSGVPALLTLSLQRLLLLLLLPFLLQSMGLSIAQNTSWTVDASIPPFDPTAAGKQENVHTYRSNNGIDFGYQTKLLSPELCRHTTEEHCQQMDERFSQLAMANRRSLRRHLQSNPEGSFNVLVVLMRFADHGDRTVPSREVVERLWNADDVDSTNYPTGSIKRYFQENSYGKLNIQATVTDWYTTAQTEAYYADGVSSRPINGQPSKITEALIPILDDLERSGVDFNLFDNGVKDATIDVTVIMHTSYSAERGNPDCFGTDPDDRIRSFAQGYNPGLWSSANSLVELGPYVTASIYRGECNFNIARMGVAVHEAIHTFGIPDLYDLAGPLNNFGSIGGISGYDTMANPGGQSGRQAYPGFLSPWTKMQLGFLDPIEIQVDGTYVAQASETTETVYVIRQPYASGEYLLIENRQPISFDSFIWDNNGGILIYHCDDTVNSWLGNPGAGNKFRGFPGQDGWPGNLNHYQVALLQADRLYEQEKALNNGHAADFWREGSRLGPGPGTSTYNGNPNDYPNTDSYSFNSGGVRQTGLAIDNFQEVQPGVWSFDVNGLGSEPIPTPTTAAPTRAPTTDAPTRSPTQAPVTNAPTRSPTRAPTTDVPTRSPTLAPVTDAPTRSPTREPTTNAPTRAPTTDIPTIAASQQPTALPSSTPSVIPSLLPSVSSAPTGGCCSRNFRDCDAPISCGVSEDECNNCEEDPSVIWKPRGAELKDSCVARFEPCNAAPANCCGPTGFLSCSIPAGTVSNGTIERFCWADIDLLVTSSPTASSAPSTSNPTDLRSAAPSVVPTLTVAPADSQDDTPEESTLAPTAQPEPDSVTRNNSGGNGDDDSSGLTRGEKAGIALGALVGSVCCCYVCALAILRHRYLQENRENSEDNTLGDELLDEETGEGFKDEPAGTGAGAFDGLSGEEDDDSDEESDDSDDEESGEESNEDYDEDDSSDDDDSDSDVAGDSEYSDTDEDETDKKRLS